ncbi:hypothetical protein 3TG000032 [Iridovirus CN01]|nr:hypothetical protein 4TH000115 [Iridovirus CN01]UPA43465.1 hypothetical protein 3TG000032 [Iridovirus CN01]UPA43660.1 hypothetical protein 1DG000068 [Iridovirus CN01]UPA43822.1 hypothetical protein L2A02_0068 [Iridovirus CN01]
MEMEKKHMITKKDIISKSISINSFSLGQPFKSVSNFTILGKYESENTKKHKKFVVFKERNCNTSQWFFANNPIKNITADILFNKTINKRKYKLKNIFSKQLV